MKLVMLIPLVWVLLYLLEFCFSLKNKRSKKIHFALTLINKKILNKKFNLINNDFNIEEIFLNSKKTPSADVNRTISNNKEYEHLIYNEFYKVYLNKSRPMSKKLNYSKPFTTILNRVISHFPKEITKEIAELEIERLRKLTTEEVANYFVNLKIDRTEEYWYYYYILSKVALKGRINQNNQLAEEWDLPDPNETDSDFANDEFYYKLKSKEQLYKSKLDKCKVKTLAEIKHHIEKISIPKKKNLPEHQKHTEMLLAKEFWYLNIQNKSLFQLSDLRFDDKVVDFFKNSSFFFKQIESQLPKGIIHHIHLSACFNNFYEAMTNTFINTTNQEMILNGEFVSVRLAEEDKIKKGEFYNTKNLKIFFIEDVKKLIYSSTPELEKLFKENFILPDGSCTVTTEKTKNFPIEENLKVYFYWRFCGGTLYSYRVEEIRKIAQEKKFYKRPVDYKIKINLIRRLVLTMKSTGNIFENEYAREMPKSKTELSFSLEDFFSNAIWEKFESIFGMYENLFDNPMLMKELLKILANTLAKQKIYGVEFRQKYDKFKKNSKYSGIKEAFHKENILTSFILPGRKVVNGNGLKANIEELDKNKEEDVSGFDFVGYEDDPFSGARNFFSFTILNDKNKIINNTNDEFKMFFNSLKNGKKFYPHAGETIYIPDYPIDENFMDKFYINDNLIHSALLPNVERLGHGFAVINNGLLATIFKKKKISLEICPISNQLLYYHKVYENPGLKLLRHGLKVAISPDDPGFFGYMGVGMDWFYLMMQNDIKPSEIYMLLKNSILKASPNIQKQKEILIPKLQNDLEAFFENLRCDVTQEELKSLLLRNDDVDHRDSIENHRKAVIRRHIDTNNILAHITKNNIMLNMYSKKHIIERAKKKNFN